MLNANCSHVGGCDADSPQTTWLRQDLAASTASCTVAYWHQPLYSSGRHGNNPELQAFWEALYAQGVELVLNGHDHDYERFAPQDPYGNADPDRGIREIVVGTGGKDLRGFTDVKPNSQVRSNAASGVLKLTLNASSYTWEFIPIAGESFTDRGSGTCH